MADRAVIHQWVRRNIDPDNIGVNIVPTSNEIRFEMFYTYHGYSRSFSETYPCIVKDGRIIVKYSDMHDNMSTTQVHALSRLLDTHALSGYKLAVQSDLAFNTNQP